jgi:hypothetical protein
MFFMFNDLKWEVVSCYWYWLKIAFTFIIKRLCFYCCSSSQVFSKKCNVNIKLLLHFAYYILAVIFGSSLLLDKKSLKIPKGWSEAVIEEGQTIQWPLEKRQK